MDIQSEGSDRLSRRTLSNPQPVLLGLTAAFVFGAASQVAAQGPSEAAARDTWTITALGGMLSYDPSDGDNFLIFSLRADTPMADYLRVEVETSFSRPDVQQDAEFIYDPSLPTESANIFTLTVGIQFRHAMGPFEPYAGASGGVFARYDDDSEGQRFSRNTFAFPMGVRLWVTDNLGIRREFRIRRDNHELFTKTSTELTAGVLWTF